MTSLTKHENSAPRSVQFVAHLLTHYREPFHRGLRATLAAKGIDYNLIYSDPVGAEASKGDTIDIEWATKVPSREIGVGGRRLVWQNLPRHVREADLLILGQENKLLHNYLLLLARKFGLVRRVALFGHGRNFQGDRSSLSERFKRLYTSAPDWWFAYTEQSKQAVEAVGFPADRITVFQNAIDTSALAVKLESVTPEDMRAFRRRIGEDGAEIGLFLGGLYQEKRLAFLFDAADRIKEQRPHFILLVAGDGPERDAVVAAGATRPWLRWLGPTFGRDKAILLKAADLFLMPGLVGLAVLDCLAAGLPMVTTAFPWHSPEIAYLADGAGVIERDWENPEAYARSVVRLLADPVMRSKIAAAAKSAASAYTMEEMVSRFASGICQCLSVTNPTAAGTTSNLEVTH